MSKYEAAQAYAYYAKRADAWYMASPTARSLAHCSLVGQQVYNIAIANLIGFASI